MRTLRLSLAGTVILILLGGFGAVGTLAQSEAEPAQDGVVEDVLFEIVVPLATMPDQLSKINLEYQIIEPGVDASIDTTNEGIRGRALYLDSGDLVIEPMAESLLWRQVASTDGAPVTVSAGESVALSPGDLILLPAIPTDKLDPTALVRISNPGTEPAITMGFHMHQSGGTFPGWPQGIRGIGSPTTYDGDTMDQVSSGDTTFRLSRLTLEPGASVPIPAEALFRLYRVEAGQIEATTSGPGGETTVRWGPDGGGEPTPMDTLQAAGDAPASVLELLALPSGALGGTPTLTGEASAKAEWAAVSGTSACELGAAGDLQMDTPPYSLTNRILRCSDESTDPRVSGPSTVVFNLETWDGREGFNAVQWSDYLIEGPEGTWAGHIYGLYDDEGVLRLVGILSGDEAYEGLTFTVAGTVAPGTATLTYDGLIQPGSPPPGFPVTPFPEPLPSPASE